MSVVIQGGTCPGCNQTASVRPETGLCDACESTTQADPWLDYSIFDLRRMGINVADVPTGRKPSPPPRPEQPKPQVRLDGAWVDSDAVVWWVLGFAFWLLVSAVTLVSVF